MNVIVKNVFYLSLDSFLHYIYEMKQPFRSFLFFFYLWGCILDSSSSFSQCTVAGHYNLVGNATSSPPYTCVILTPDQLGMAGCAWNNTTTLNFGSDFSYDFTINLGTNPNGADGMTFVAQNDPRGLCASGSSQGSTLGASGISNSLIIEVDTYLSLEDRDDGMPGVLCTGGPEADHLDIWTNGNVNPPGTGCPTPAGARIIPNAIELMNGAALYNIKNGLDHTLRISWNSSTNTITAKVMNTALTYTYGTVSYSFNPMSLFGTMTPYFGFTAATGGLSNQQSFCTTSSVLLPIELLEFHATCKNNKAELHWTTATETNNNYFTIERGDDQNNFKPIARVDGAGNSTTARSYTWNDENPLTEASYYRLRQTDYDAKTTISSPVYLPLCSPNDIVINIQPNPSSGTFNVSFLVKENASVTIKLSDVYGRQIKTIATNEPKENGFCSYTVDGADLANGVYFLTFIVNDFIVVKKIIRN